MVTVTGTERLRDNLGRFLGAVDAAALRAAQEGAKEIESAMQSGASWQDITGAARSGLHAKATYINGEGIEITGYNDVDYGVYLELRWGGRYAIIKPTIERMAPGILARIQSAVDNIE